MVLAGVALVLWWIYMALGFGFQHMFTGFLGGGSKDVVAVVESADKKYKAILVETNGGATTSFGYEIFIEPISARQRQHLVARLYAAGRNESAYGANLVWIGPRILAVHYLRARTEELKMARPIINGEQFFVRLRNGIRDDSAPPGGMLYDLEHPRGYRGPER